MTCSKSQILKLVKDIGFRTGQENNDIQETECHNMLKKVENFSFWGSKIASNGQRMERKIKEEITGRITSQSMLPNRHRIGVLFPKRHI
jgi:hypothetical protein